MTNEYELAQAMYDGQAAQIDHNPEGYKPNTTINQERVGNITREENPDLEAVIAARNAIGKEELTLTILAINDRLGQKGRKPIPMPKFN